MIKAVAICSALACLCSLLILSGSAQTLPPGAKGVVRLRVRVKIGDSTKGLSRKRFYLVRGSLAENQSLITAIEQQQVVSRDCYYRGLNASNEFIKWMKTNDCESVYCREIALSDIEGSEAVPEFQRAVADGVKQFGSPDIARKWMPVNLPNDLRDGFYRKRQTELDSLLKIAAQSSHGDVMSVMTDRNGTAFFTGIDPGVYVVSNLVATEAGDKAITWNCELNVKPGDLATEKPYLVSNVKDKTTKCVGVERPIAACPSATK